MSKRFQLSQNDKILAGVCGGIAEYLGADPTIIRVLYAIATFLSLSIGFWIYILLWILSPKKA